MDDQRKLLVDRIAASRYLSRSARLRDLLLYLCERGVEGQTEEIHEQEVGHRVFGRPADYDTTSDNIVRVHASMLRKRLEQYFSAEGAEEPLVIEIPKGNYAPVFRERQIGEAPASTVERPTDWRIWSLGAAALLFACTTVFLLLPRLGPPAAAGRAHGPTVSLFWSQIFRPNQTTDLVLDDAAIGLYQELTGHMLTLSDYFDRSYQRTLPETAAVMVLRRQSGFANATFLWKLYQLAGADMARTNLIFARDYSFRGLKSDNVVLLGNSRSNPWVEPFEAKMGLRWAYDQATHLYYPVDQTEGKSYRLSEPAETREGYAVVALMPNLGGNGNVLLVSATGGSAMNSAADYLANEEVMAQLRRSLAGAGADRFPPFEAMLRLKGRSTRPRDAAIVLSRALRTAP